jgi:hypothetical protein
MNKYNCKSEHNPPHSYGDCIRACIATLIDDPETPHFYKDGGSVEKFWQLLRQWLELKHGKSVALFTVEDHWEFMAINNPGIPYMLLCKTASGVDHAVVCLNGKVFHDPSICKNEITGEHSSGFWIIGIIVSV